MNNNDFARKRAERLLRYRYPAQHRDLYIKERGTLGRKEDETPREYANRLSNAYSRATSRLKALYPIDYKRLFEEGKNKI